MKWASGNDEVGISPLQQYGKSLKKMLDGGFGFPTRTRGLEARKVFEMICSRGTPGPKSGDWKRDEAEAMLATSFSAVGSLPIGRPSESAVGVLDGPGETGCLKRGGDVKGSGAALGSMPGWDGDITRPRGVV